jgi:hypothetical protein
MPLIFRRRPALKPWNFFGRTELIPVFVFGCGIMEPWRMLFNRGFALWFSIWVTCPEGIAV